MDNTDHRTVWYGDRYGGRYGERRGDRCGDRYGGRCGDRCGDSGDTCIVASGGMVKPLDGPVLTRLRYPALVAASLRKATTVESCNNVSIHAGYTCLCIYLCICPCTCLRTYLRTCLFACLYMCPCTCLSTCLCTCLSTCLCTCLRRCPYVSMPDVALYITVPATCTAPHHRRLPALGRGICVYTCV